jgi:hypothetical protein
VGWVTALDDAGGTVWIVDAHRDGKRFVVRSDEQMATFLAQRATRGEESSKKEPQ